MLKAYKPDLASQFLMTLDVPIPLNSLLSIHLSFCNVYPLDSLVFMGSEKYPYKGIIDHFANRGFSNGTNAWTDTFVLSPP